MNERRWNVTVAVTVLDVEGYDERDAIARARQSVDCEGTAATFQFTPALSPADHAVEVG